MVTCENTCDLQLLSLIINQNMRKPKQIAFIIPLLEDRKAALVLKKVKEMQLKCSPKLISTNDYLALGFT